MVSDGSLMVSDDDGEAGCGIVGPELVMVIRNTLSGHGGREKPCR